MDQWAHQLDQWVHQLEPWMHQVKQWIHQLDQQIRQQPAEQLYVALAVLFLTSFFLLFRVFKRTRSNTIVLAGLSGSGKTILFYQLREGTTHQGTVTSIEPNEGSFVLHSESEKDFIRKQLEKEVDKLRATRTGASAADIADEFTLGVSGEAFVFSQCHNKVTIAEASGLTGETSQVEQFIREHVRP